MFLMYTCLFHSLILLQYVCAAFSKLTGVFSKTSDRRLVAISSRIAVILTFSTLVIVNRIAPFFKNIESSTAILEFIASAIIIPVVFEWISSANAIKSSSK